VLFESAFSILSIGLPALDATGTTDSIQGGVLTGAVREIKREID